MFSRVPSPLSFFHQDIIETGLIQLLHFEDQDLTGFSGHSLLSMNLHFIDLLIKTIKQYFHLTLKKELYDPWSSDNHKSMHVKPWKGNKLTAFSKVKGHILKVLDTRP